MNLESTALQEVQNPVDSKPKILSLDPHKPALTPTEIRNIAGQKTAVFCRKMNTWLLRPLSAHKVKKRDVDDEFEERTYNHHGYHTVQYSHYGRETRRRYRNPNRINARNRTQTYQIAAENRNQRHSPEKSSETFNFNEISHRPIHNNHYQAGNYGMAPKKENIQIPSRTDLHTEQVSRMFDDFSPAHHSNFQTPEEYNIANNHSGFVEAGNRLLLNDPKPISDRGISNSLLDDTENAPIFVNPTTSDSHFGYQIRFPHNFEGNFSSIRDSTNEILPNNSKHFIPNFKYGSAMNNEVKTDLNGNVPTAFGSINTFLKTKSIENSSSDSSFQNSVPNKLEDIISADHNKNISNIPYVPYQESRSEYLESLRSQFDSFSPTFAPKTQRSNLHQSHYSSGKKNDERVPNAKLYRQSTSRNSNIETEALPGEVLINVNSYEPEIIPETKDIQSTTQDPDVSINVLEIPKISKKFENLDDNIKSNIAVQNNEDVHTVFEGFYDLRGNYPSSDPNHIPNSGIYQQQNGERTQKFINSNSQKLTIHQPSHFDDYDQFTDKSNPETDVSIYPTTKVTTSTDEFVYSTFAPEDERINTQSNYLNKITEPTDTFYSNLNNRNVFETFAHAIKNSPDKENAFAVNRILSNEFSFPNTLNRNRFLEGNTLDTVPKSYVITESPPILRNISISNHRSDLPSENIFEEDINDNGISSNPKRIEGNVSSKPSINNTNKDRLYTDIRPNLITGEEVSSHRIRFQNILRDFKPDKIIIDVEKISTQRPPDSTSDFRHRSITSEPPIRRSFSNVIQARDRQSEQSVGTTWRSHPVYITRTPRLRERHGVQKQVHNGITFHVRKDIFPHQQERNNSRQQGHPHLIHNRNEIPIHNQIVSTHQFNHPHQFNHQLQMNALPPGVSVHPRHPQAPYANMVQTNMLQSLPQQSINRRPHRQRHHRKKDRFANSCCRTSESSNTRQPCCRSGGSCCSGFRRTMLPRTPCCSSKNNHNKQGHFPHRSQKQVQNDQPPHETKGNLLDNRDRCQKEKMCRTVYESTQQVMVCRNVNIAGC